MIVEPIYHLCEALAAQQMSSREMAEWLGIVIYHGQSQLDVQPADDRFGTITVAISESQFAEIVVIEIIRGLAIYDLEVVFGPIQIVYGQTGPCRTVKRLLFDDKQYPAVVYIYVDADADENVTMLTLNVNHRREH